MRTAVTCEECGHRNSLERNSFKKDEVIHLICHGCELPLHAVFDKPSTLAATPNQKIEPTIEVPLWVKKALAE